MLNAAIGNGTATGGVKDNLDDIANNNFIGTPLGNFLNEEGQGVSDVPKAYLTWLFFDENFNFVPQGSGALRVEKAGDCADPLVANDLRVPKNGYVVVYVSNESKGNVYFDDIRIEHISGSLVEENHYSPFVRVGSPERDPELLNKLDVFVPIHFEELC